MLSVRATARYSRAIHATAELLTKLRLDFAFVGNVARAAWLGGEAGSGSIDVLAVMSPEQKNQVAMMASNRGFRVDREEIEGTIELDLIPLQFVDAEGDVRVHVLVASNALYGRIVAAAREIALLPAARGEGGRRPDEGRSESQPLTPASRVAAPEDLALLFTVAEDPDRDALLALPDFDHRKFNDRLRSIGLGMAVAE